MMRALLLSIAVFVCISTNVSADIFAEGTANEFTIDFRTDVRQLPGETLPELCGNVSLEIQLFHDPVDGAANDHRYAALSLGDNTRYLLLFFKTVRERAFQGGRATGQRSLHPSRHVDPGCSQDLGLPADLPEGLEPGVADLDIPVANLRCVIERGNEPRAVAVFFQSSRRLFFELGIEFSAVEARVEEIGETRGLKGVLVERGTGPPPRWEIPG